MSASKINDVNLAKIKNRLLISGDLKIISQMHISMGELESSEYTSENSILYTRLGYDNETKIPYIPSSSIKGVLRAEAERIARIFDQTDPKVKYICKGKDKCDVQNKEAPCVICKIFGGNGLASKIIIADALPTKDSIDKIHIRVKPGIAIDRKKQTSHEQSLFFIESLQPGVSFQFRIIINNILKNNEPEFKILRSLFKMIQMGFIFIGGKKSIGYGRFNLENAIVKELSSKEDFLFPENIKEISLESYFDL
ncbi:MAG: type III-B CRISPR module RAMP protein Cmr6 [Promethearchaeota archaeon]